MDSWQSPHGRRLPVIGRRTLIMGVLNVTPDSFSDGGQLATTQAIVERAGAMIEAGADVLDLGGESTRPGAQPVGVEEELARVLPAIAALRRAWPEVPLSIDTSKADVADAAIVAGADIINDVWGLLYEASSGARAQWRELARSNAPIATRDRPDLTTPFLHPSSGCPKGAINVGMEGAALSAPRVGDGGDEAPPSLDSHSPAPRPADQAGGTAGLPVPPMAQVAARRRCPVILMHNRPDRAYADFWADVVLDLQASVTVARAAGIADHQLWLDPGFGFAKNVAQNLEVLRELRRIVALGFPVLVGTSRKSTLGAVLGTTVEDRLEGGGATVVWAIQQGCAMVRVHDVREMARFARMADAIKAGLGFSPT